MAAHGAGQSVAQGAALVSGILIIRALDKPEYAAYSLAIWMIAAVSVVSDAGVGGVLLGLGQSARDDPPQLSRFIQRPLDTASGSA